MTGKSQSLLSCATLALLLFMSIQVHARSPSPALRELVSDSDRILIGRVHKTRTELEQVTVARGGKMGTLLFTYVTVADLEELKSEQPAESVEFRIIGGRSDDYLLVAVHAPTVEINERVLLFLKESERPVSPDRPTYFPSSGKASKFRIQDVAGTEMVEGESPDSSVPIFGVPEEGHIPLDEVRSLIAAELAR